MKCKPEQLQAQLNKPLLPIYMVTGDELLIVEECCDLIRSNLQQQGFTEREVMHIDASFSWEYLLECANALSLFAERKIIELRLSSQKLNKQASKILQQYLANPAPDNILLVIADKQDGGTKKSAWYKAVEQHGALIEVWPVELAQLPSWLQQRAATLGLSLDNDAIQLLCDRVEGNLLAAKQELDKLSLLHPNQTLTAEMIIAAVSDNSRYDIYGLTDAAIQGQAARTQKIIQVLRQEGTEATVILWALSREIRSLLNLQYGLQNGIAFDTLCQKERVWGKRKPLVRKAMQRCTAVQLNQLLERCYKTDQMIKGMRAGNHWLELASISLALAGKPLQLPVDAH